MFAYTVLDGVFFGILFTCLYIKLCVHGKPSAMDVYQGKTTLQITYVDSVAVDSVVIFKK